MATALVIGASRGIGYHLAADLAATGAYAAVYGSIRKPTALPTNNVQSITLDVTDSASVTAAASAVDRLDLLVVNAGIGEPEYLLNESEDQIRSYLETNTLAPLRVVKAFLPALRKGDGKKVIFISSAAGSLARQAAGIGARPTTA